MRWGYLLFDYPDLREIKKCLDGTWEEVHPGKYWKDP